MDYKEKYNAALERAKAFELPEYKNIMASVFPELKESENERIRDSLINFLKSPFVHENITDEKVAPWIAWLEKQGKKQSIWTDRDRTMAFTLLRDVDQMTYISEEGKNERLQWLNSLEDKFSNGE